MSVFIFSAPNTWNLQTANTVLLLLCAALMINLIVISVLIYTMKKKTGCCNGNKSFIHQFMNGILQNLSMGLMLLHFCHIVNRCCYSLQLSSESAGTVEKINSYCSLHVCIGYLPSPKILP